VREAVSTLLLVGLVMAMTLYGNAISMGIIQEKESRVAELLVGAVPPTQILVGKVVGIGGAGLLQVLVWMLVSFLVSGPRLVAAIGRWLGLEELAFSPGILPAPILAAFTLFFLLGYTIYALVYAAFASTVARAEEVNQALIAYIADYSDYLFAHTCSLTVRLDGQDLYGAEDYDDLYLSVLEPFDVELFDGPDNFADGFGLVGGTVPTVGTGHYAKLAPLTPGDHVLEFGGVICDGDDVLFETLATYELHVGP